MNRDNFGAGGENRQQGVGDDGVIRITADDIATTNPRPRQAQREHRPSMGEEIARRRYGIVIEPPKQREEIFVGVVRLLRRWQTPDDYIVALSNQLRQRQIHVLSFEVEMVDGEGNPYAHVPVEVRGHEISGDTLNDGTPVAVYGARSRDGTIYTGRVLNLRTAAALRVMVTPRERCFVATAVYEDEEAPTVQTLRAFRERVLRRNPAGRAFINIYNRIGPRLAEQIERHPWLKRPLRACLDWLVNE